MTTKNITQQIESESTRSSGSKSIYRWTIVPKGKNPAYVGDCVIHPDGSIGKIVSGQSNVSFGKRQAACVGDKVECPGHEGVIMQGAKSISIGGKSLAREGDKTTCGGVIMSGFPTITAFDRTRTMYGKGMTDGQEIRLTLLKSVHSEQKGYVNMPFSFKLDGGEIGKGVIDENGELCFEIKPDTKEAEIELPNGQSFMIKLMEEQGSEQERLSAKGFGDYQSESSSEESQSYSALIEDKE
ncbi:PAAR domain-containing protein [Aggregatibacter actinomycetemcomitans]|uniref:PAAR domain-containing protein n=2 Tax=Aggregatibacter actinomycetemcomitans TaxID=714 RepID=UPI00197C24D8|nr:PAAR domain-containing protein [Aggregatibacter actinomycetemcomitans]MBN6074374.1 PAAR domain-containing protein [Aggregatibacter actinomycetemcomitans]